MTSLDTQVILESLHQEQDGTAIFIAEDENHQPLGLIHLFMGSDYYQKTPHAHISDLIVATGAEGRGVGESLMQAGETWAKDHGFHWLTLSVFAQNVRARKLYERMGFGEDIVKYVKEL